MNTKPLLFSVTANDCEWSYTKGTGAGGQKRNKTSSAVHCMHRASGAHGYSEASRSQGENKTDAFSKMVATDKFKKWLHVETMRRTGKLIEIERTVENELKKVKIEVKIDDKWVEVNTDQLVDNPDDFDVSKVKAALV
jgi:protein subunit release factor B